MIEAPDFLPLGSVVRVKGNSKKLLLVSRGLAVDTEEGKRYYDYGFAFYPEGLIGDTVIYSNHDCIDEVLFEGFSDDDDRETIEALNEVLPKMTIPKATPSAYEEW